MKFSLNVTKFVLDLCSYFVLFPLLLLIFVHLSCFIQIASHFLVLTEFVLFICFYRNRPHSFALFLVFFFVIFNFYSIFFLLISTLTFFCIKFLLVFFAPTKFDIFLCYYLAPLNYCHMFSLTSHSIAIFFYRITFHVLIMYHFLLLSWFDSSFFSISVLYSCSYQHLSHVFLFIQFLALTTFVLFAYYHLNFHLLLLSIIAILYYSHLIPSQSLGSHFLALQKVVLFFAHIKLYYFFVLISDSFSVKVSFFRPYINIVLSSCYMNSCCPIFCSYVILTYYLVLINFEFIFLL